MKRCLVNFIRKGKSITSYNFSPVKLTTKSWEIEFGPGMGKETVSFIHYWCERRLAQLLWEAFDSLEEAILQMHTP